MAIAGDVTRKECCGHKAYASDYKTFGIIWHIKRGKIRVDCLFKQPSVTTGRISNYWASQ